MESRPRRQSLTGIDRTRDGWVSLHTQRFVSSVRRDRSLLTRYRLSWRQYRMSTSLPFHRQTSSPVHRPTKPKCFLNRFTTSSSRQSASPRPPSLLGPNMCVLTTLPMNDRSNVLPLKKLGIRPGKSAWVLYIDIVCINYDGNAFDAAVLAVMTALRNSESFTSHAVWLPSIGAAAWIIADAFFWNDCDSGLACGNIRRGLGADDMFEDRDEEFEGRSEEYTSGLHVWRL